MIGEIYHIVVRAIEGFNLFRDNKDYYRCIHDLFEFNDKKPTQSNYRIAATAKDDLNLARTVLDRLAEIKNRTKRELLVEILSFCLMPNHIHLLLKQLTDDGISAFMRKIGAGFVGYYNNRYHRKGHLFDGRYRAVRIEDDEQLKTVFVYIHTNPVSLIASNWKEGGISEEILPETIDFIEKYKWSSYSDYLGVKNFPSLTSREFLTGIMNDKEGMRQFVNDWLKFKSKSADLNTAVIE